MQFSPDLLADALAWYDPALTSGLKSAANGTGSSPAALDDVVKYAANRVSGGVNLTSSTGCLWSPTGFNSLPAFKFAGAHVLTTAAMFAAQHERAITIAFNVTSTSDSGNPVILNDTGGVLRFQEVGGTHLWAKTGGNYGFATSAPSVPETQFMSYDGNQFYVTGARDGYRRDAGPGGLASFGTALHADLGITGAGLCVGAYGAGGANATCMIGDIVAIGRGLVGAERADLMGWMAERGNVGNCPFIGFVGDSIFDGTAIAVGEDTRIPANNACEMAYAAVVANGYRINRTRDSYPGRQGPFWLGEYPLWTVPFIYRGLSSKSMAFVQFAHNDLRTFGATYTLATVREICLRLVQLGVTPIVVTPLPSTFSGFEALRQSYITQLLAAQASSSPLCPALVRWDLESTMGPEAAASSTTLYQDGIHPTALGNTYLYPLLVTAAKDFLDGRIPVVSAAVVTVPTAAENAAALVAALAGAVNVDALNPTDTEGTTTIVAGDDYTDGDLLDRRLTYTVEGFSGSIDGATVRWKAVRRAYYDRDDATAAELTVTSGEATLADGVLSMKVPLTTTQTAALQDTVINTSAANYKITVALVSGGEVLTQVLADGFVLKRIG